MNVDLPAVSRALAEAGLAVRGAFHPRPEDAVPPLPDGRAVATLVLAGNVGASLWGPFQRAVHEAGGRLMLDEWSRRVLTGMTRELGAHALFPFEGPPYLPFQRWAVRAESVFPSPIGPLIHPDYGLWHAYRGALAFADALSLPPRQAATHPCGRCAARPCLSTCPVDALAEGRYDVARCIAHVGSDAGRDCLQQGCRARRACPVGTQHRYPPEQAQLHIQAFLRRAQKIGDW